MLGCYGDTDMTDFATALEAMPLPPPETASATDSLANRLLSDETNRLSAALKLRGVSGAPLPPDTCHHRSAGSLAPTPINRAERVGQA